MGLIEDRLKLIEERLARLEHTVMPSASSPSARTSAEISHPLWSQRASSPQTSPILHHDKLTPAREVKGSSVPLVTRLLGFGGAAAIVLAAAYLIRLAVASGWLNPERQIGLAVLGAFILIALGIKFRRADSDYAGILPATGIVILYIATYAAHLFYILIPSSMAFGCVIGIALLALWLCKIFNSTLYAFFAVIGTYSVPFLISGVVNNLVGLAFYFAVWSVVFCVFAISVKSRPVYLLALYLSLIAFDWAWRRSGVSSEWQIVILFQTLILPIYVITTAYFSLRHRAPLTEGESYAHLPGLLIFYFLQYAILSEHLPFMAPWIAIGSAAFIGGCYYVCRSIMTRELSGGLSLLRAYIALVMFHAGYLDGVAEEYKPLTALLIVPAVAVYFLRSRTRSGFENLILIGVGIIYGVNLLRVLTLPEREVFAASLLSLAYSIELYAAYYFARKERILKDAWPFILGAGHIAAICTAARLIDHPIAVSVVWAALALGCIQLALEFKDKLLGKSSLLIFAVSAIKVALFDLASSPSLVRVLTLLVVGGSFYAGGALYRKIDAIEEQSI